MHDRRTIHVKLTDKGLALRDQLGAMHSRHVEMLQQTAVTAATLETASATLRRLERFWMNSSDLALGARQVSA